MKKLSKNILSMLRFLIAVTAMLALITIGTYGMVWAMINAFVHIVTFIGGALAFIFGVFILKMMSDNLK
tara:strand:- start:431 stop:637 length:207 start_codon:yes stop_codon:yes gene_type:complete